MTNKNKNTLYSIRIVGENNEIARAASLFKSKLSDMDTGAICLNFTPVDKKDFPTSTPYFTISSCDVTNVVNDYFKNVIYIKGSYFTSEDTNILAINYLSLLSSMNITVKVWFDLTSVANDLHTRTYFYMPNTPTKIYKVENGELSETNDDRIDFRLVPSGKKHKSIADIYNEIELLKEEKAYIKSLTKKNRIETTIAVNGRKVSYESILGENYTKKIRILQPGDEEMLVEIQVNKLDD